MLPLLFAFLLIFLVLRSWRGVLGIAWRSALINACGGDEKQVYSKTVSVDTCTLAMTFKFASFTLTDEADVKLTVPNTDNGI